MAVRGPYQDQQDGNGGAQRECARGIWCSEPRLARADDGTVTRLPALVFQAFCPPDRSMISHCLDELPTAYDRLGAEIGEQSRTGSAIRVPFGPRLPLRADIDALMREMVAVLGSWHERVASVARLAAPDTTAGPRELSRQVKEAAAVLGAHLDALLALPAEPMVRVMHPEAAGDWMADPQADGIVRASGEVHALLPLSGADAGNEVLALHYRARRILGETKAAPESFDGIPCRSCENMALERAEPPSDPDRPAMHSRCAECGHMMDRKTFAEWAKWYSGWADRAGLTCRRCSARPVPRCGECVYAKCACAARGHAPA